MLWSRSNFDQLRVRRPALVLATASWKQNVLHKFNQIYPCWVHATFFIRLASVFNCNDTKAELALFL